MVTEFAFGNRTQYQTGWRTARGLQEFRPRNLRIVPKSPSRGSLPKRNKRVRQESRLDGGAHVSLLRPSSLSLSLSGHPPPISSLPGWLSSRLLRLAPIYALASGQSRAQQLRWRPPSSACPPWKGPSPLIRLRPIGAACCTPWQSNPNPPLKSPTEL